MSNRMSNLLTDAQVAANDARRGVPRSAETKAKIAAVRKYNPVSDETRVRMSLSKTGRSRPEGFIDRLAVINSVPVLIDGKRYESQKAVSSDYGISTNAVRRRLKSTDAKWSGWTTL